MNGTIAVVGDVHGHFDAVDVRQLDAAGYDLILFVGDLTGYRPGSGVAVARVIATLRTPALVLPGNHDGVTLLQLAAEVFPRLHPLRPKLGALQPRRVKQLARCLGAVPLVGYEVRSVPMGGGEEGNEHALQIIACRPHTMGGENVAFRRFLFDRFGVRTLDDSAALLCRLVDDAPPGPLLFLAHNGPSGLGEHRTDPFGCDFRAEEGDWGDRDLREALEHAKTSGRDVLAVVAGHMHHAVRGGGRRRWRVQERGTAIVNAARVPRVFERDGRRQRHHVRLALRGDEVSVSEVILEG